MQGSPFCDRIGSARRPAVSQGVHQEHIIGCQGVKLFLLKDITITIVTTATDTTVTITTVPIGFFLVFSQFYVFAFCHNLFFLVLSQFEFFSFVTIFFKTQFEF